MNISIDAGPASDPDVQALASALGEGVSDAKILYRIKARDEHVVSDVLHFVAQHGPRAAIYVGGLVTKKVVDVTTEWARTRWFTKKPPGKTVVIYGPDGQPVKTIERSGEGK